MNIYQRKYEFETIYFQLFLFPSISNTVRYFRVIIKTKYLRACYGVQISYHILWCCAVLLQLSQHYYVPCLSKTKSPTIVYCILDVHLLLPNNHIQWRSTNWKLKCTFTINNSWGNADVFIVYYGASRRGTVLFVQIKIIPSFGKYTLPFPPPPTFGENQRMHSCIKNGSCVYT